MTERTRSRMTIALGGQFVGLAAWAAVHPRSFATVRPRRVETVRPAEGTVMKTQPSTAAGRVPADPAAFVAEAERITNEHDVDAAIKVYADDAVVELVTDGVLERYVGLSHVTEGWRAIMAALGRRNPQVRKTVLAVSDGVVVNSWTGSLAGSADARGLDIWHFDGDGRVREHKLYTFLSVRPSTHPLARLRFALTHPVAALILFREQRRFGVKPSSEEARR